MALSLEYAKRDRRTGPGGPQRGLILATLGLALANLTFAVAYFLHMYEWPPFCSWAAPADHFAGKLTLTALPVVSAMLAAGGMLRAAFFPRPLQSLLFGSAALTLDAAFYLLVVRNVP